MKYKLCVAIVFTVLTGQALCMEATDPAVKRQRILSDDPPDGIPDDWPDDGSDAGLSYVTDMSEAMSDITDMTAMTTTSMTTHAPGLRQAVLDQMEQAGTQKQVEHMFKILIANRRIGNSAKYLNIHAHHFADPVPVPAVAENPRLLAIDVEWLMLWDVFEEKYTEKPLRVSMVDKDGNIVFDHLIKDCMMADGRWRFLWRKWGNPYYNYDAIICINRFISDNPSSQPSPMTKAMDEAKQRGKGLFSWNNPDDEENISTYLNKYGARYNDVVNDIKAQLNEPNTFLVVAGGEEDRKLLDVTEYPYLDIQYLYLQKYEQGSRDRGRKRKRQEKLRDLAKQILEKNIQTTDRTGRGPDAINYKRIFRLGHSSVEDAQATMKLLLYKMVDTAEAKAWTPKLNINDKTRTSSHTKRKIVFENGPFGLRHCDSDQQVIDKVHDGFQAFRLGVKEGWVIHQVNGIRVTHETVVKAIENAKESQEAQITLTFEIPKEIRIGDLVEVVSAGINFGGVQLPKSTRGKVFSLTSGNPAYPIQVDVKGYPSLNRALFRRNQLRVVPPMDAATRKEWRSLTHHMQDLGVGIKLDMDDKTTWIRRESTSWGMTAVHKATVIMGGLPRALQWMLDADVDVNMTDNHNYTPLHQAVRKGTKHQEECAMLLLAAGADKHAKNEDGQTPSDVARSMGWTDVADAIDAYIKPDSEIQ